MVIVNFISLNFQFKLNQDVSLNNCLMQIEIQRDYIFVQKP